MLFGRLNDPRHRKKVHTTIGNSIWLNEFLWMETQLNVYPKLYL
jgi:hypothetical protein